MWRYRKLASVKLSYKLSGREAYDLSGKSDLKNIQLNGSAQVCISALFTAHYSRSGHTAYETFLQYTLLSIITAISFLHTLP
jgi:hypothetical protein